MRSLALTAIVFACSFAGSIEAHEENMQSPSKSISIDWRFEHAPALVWQAWTDPEWIAGWVGSDPNGTVLKVSTEVRPGGHFEFSFADSDGTVHTARGVYEAVDPLQKLAFSWSWESEPGVETSIVVDLAHQGHGTLMHFEHGGLIHASSHDYAFGWRSSFEKIAKVLDRHAEEGGGRP